MLVQLHHANATDTMCHDEVNTSPHIKEEYLYPAWVRSNIAGIHDGSPRHEEFTVVSQPRAPCRIYQRLQLEKTVAEIGKKKLLRKL